MNALTLAELRKHQADLAWKAEKLRQEWRTLPMGNRSTTMGKQVKAMQERADDYAAIIKGLEG
jgi:acyl-CoA reductase-like NAD-dependent aldehyde dehydrogenase